MANNSLSMDKFRDNSSMTLEQAISARVSSGEVKEWLEKYAVPFHELMSNYKCAMMEVETKFRVFDNYFSVGDDCNHIESIHSRLKSPLGIFDKLKRCGKEFTVKSIEDNLFDVAGVRVICSFISDIYKLEKALVNQDDVILIERKDYIQNPKPNGYRSLHLIIETPIFLPGEKKMMKVEVQLRTLAMDTWASIEHKIRYKKQNNLDEEINRELLACANACANLDLRMEYVNSVTGLNETGAQSPIRYKS